MRHGVRGRYLVLSGLVSLLLVVATGWSVVVSAQEPRFEGVTLRLATWGGSWRDAVRDSVGQELEKRGAKMEYVIGNPADSLAKLIAARGRDVPFDVVDFGDSVKPQLVEGQFLEELNFANVPNAQGLQRDRYTVAVWRDQTGIIYNVKKFEELGIPKPEQLKDLFHPKLVGRIAFPDINHSTAISGIVAFAIAAGSDESNIDPGLELIRQLKVSSFFKSSVELATKFTSGDVWAAWWTSGWLLRVRKTGVPVAASYPRVKDKQGMTELFWVGIPKGGKMRPAEFFINQYLSLQVQLAMSRKLGVGPVNEAALAELAKDPEWKDGMVVDPAIIRNMYYLDWSKVNLNEWVNKWSRVMAR